MKRFVLSGILLAGACLSYTVKKEQLLQPLMQETAQEIINELYDLLEQQQDLPLALQRRIREFRQKFTGLEGFAGYSNKIRGLQSALESTETMRKLAQLKKSTQPALPTIPEVAPPTAISAQTLSEVLRDLHQSLASLAQAF